MPTYEYEALTARGGVTRGSLSAGDEADLEVQLRAQGQYLLRAQPRAEAAVRDSAHARTDGPVERSDLLAFTEYLAAAAKAGLPLLGTLDDVQPLLQSKRLRQIVAEVRTAVAERGASLSEALAEHPACFSQLYIGAVAAGEATGHLDYVLGQLVDHLNWQETISAQLRQATLYPVLVLTTVAVLVVVLLTFVYPRLIPVLEGFRVPLPWPTRVLLGISVALQSLWPLLLALAGGGAVLLWAMWRHPRGRYALDRLILKLPLFGHLVWEINLARFVTYTALFYRTGVELVQGLVLVEKMLPNRVLAQAVRRAREDVVAGGSLAASFGRSGLFPPLVVRSIALGEATGSLDEALERSKTYYDREIPAAVRRMLTGLQPALVVALGGVIAMVALSIFLPLMSVYRAAAP